MKILLIPEYSASGGTRTYFIRLMNYYYKRGYSVHIILKNKKMDQELRDFINDYGFKVYFIKPIGIRKSIIGNKLSIVLDNIINALYLCKYNIKIQPDIVVFSQGNIYQDILQLFILKKFIYIVHSAPTTQIHVFISYLLSKKINTGRVILTVSRHAKECILNYWLNKHSNYVYYIYNYSDPNMRIKNNRFKRNIVLTIGHVVDYKNPYLWFEVALRVVKNSRVTFVWAGDGPLIDRIDQMIREKGSHNIKIIGFQKDVRKLYEKSIIYFQPSILESQGIAVIEAMSHGLPCVVSNAGGLPESVRNEENGYVVDSGFVQDYVDKIEALINNSLLREQLGLNGQKRIAKKFNKVVWFRKMDYLHRKAIL